MRTSRSTTTLVHAVVGRANMRSILVAMMKSCIAPTEADIRMMAFSFRKFTNFLDKGKRLPEIAKPEAPLDAERFLRELPVWGLCMKERGLLAREGRNSPATGSTGFAYKRFGHIFLPLVSTVGCTKAGKP